MAIDSIHERPPTILGPGSPGFHDRYAANWDNKVDILHHRVNLGQGLFLNCYAKDNVVRVESESEEDSTLKADTWATNLILAEGPLLLAEVIAAGTRNVSPPSVGHADVMRQ